MQVVDEAGAAADMLPNAVVALRLAHVALNLLGCRLLDDQTCLGPAAHGVQHGAP
jgi:hypothetical protein